MGTPRSFFTRPISTATRARSLSRRTMTSSTRSMSFLNSSSVRIFLSAWGPTMAHFASGPHPRRGCSAHARRATARGWHARAIVIASLSGCAAVRALEPLHVLLNLFDQPRRAAVFRDERDERAADDRGVG